MRPGRPQQTLSAHFTGFGGSPTMAFEDSNAPRRRRARAGVMAAQIWVKVGEPQRDLALSPTGPSELSFLSVDTRTP